MTYRTEIDGLRAISVLGVIFYHAGFSSISGGFAGVDVFFVISGYLIGGQILKELAAGQFSYWSFYGRRARRILPALFVVTLVSALLGYFILLPQDYRYFFGAAFTSLLSVSNFWFMDQIDYFNPQAALDPLVHTWSLGVEEQFYLFAPILLGVTWFRFRRLLVFLVAFLMLASLGLTLALSSSAPMFTFYMLPTRAWELFAGILVAIAFGKPWWVVCKKWHGQLSMLGLLVLLIGIVFTPSGVAWPGFWTIIPVTGTLLVLLFGQANSIARTVLSLAAMRALGVISYSAYLWHQPILSFLEYQHNMPASLIGRLAVVFLVFGVAALSWRFIEQPFRTGKLTRVWGWGVMFVMAVMIVAMSIGGHVTKGFPSRIPQEIRTFLDIVQTTGAYNKRCILSRRDVETIGFGDSCIIGSANPPSVALWGDSHAAAIADAMSDELQYQGRSAKTFMLSSCLPIPELINHSQNRQSQCPVFNARVQSYILANDSIKYVVLFATWDSYILRRGYPDMLGFVPDDDFYAYPEDGDPNMHNVDRLISIQSAFQDLVSSLMAAGKTVILVHSLPRPNIDIPRFFARQAWMGGAIPENSGYPIAYAKNQFAESRQTLVAFDVESVTGSFITVDPVETFCDEMQCFVIKDGSVLFLDGDHPSLEGAKLLAPLIAAQIKPL
ncbi:acyltransferase [Planktomarina sp.]|nr:acyltransferase [Planktomarina sp.]